MPLFSQIFAVNYSCIIEVTTMPPYLHLPGTTHTAPIPANAFSNRYALSPT
jgi:hypothetical protein